MPGYEVVGVVLACVLVAGVVWISLIGVAARAETRHRRRPLDHG